MDELQLTGGARIGMVNATFPFATLKVNNTLVDPMKPPLARGSTLVPRKSKKTME